MRLNLRQSIASTSSKSSTSSSSASNTADRAPVAFKRNTIVISSDEEDELEDSGDESGEVVEVAKT